MHGGHQSRAAKKRGARASARPRTVPTLFGPRLLAVSLAVHTERVSSVTDISDIDCDYNRSNGEKSYATRPTIVQNRTGTRYTRVTRETFKQTSQFRRSVGRSVRSRGERVPTFRPDDALATAAAGPGGRTAVITRRRRRRWSQQYDMNQLLCIGDPSQNVMAESKGSLIAKSVSKHAGRAKEKFLQNLGKVDRTEDEIFNEHLQNFSKQQNSANKLQKEFNNYIRCVRAVQVASKSLMDTLNEMYESQWVGHDHMCTDSNNLDMLWSDYTHKLADQVLIPLNTYQAQFAETRKKIDKRNRKLVDYDSQRHSNQLVNNNGVGGAGKKKDEAKMMKAKEQFDEVKRKFDLINTELHDELPALYNSRVLFLITNLQPYFAAEQLFHNESSKVFSEMESIVDKLATDYQHQSKMLNYFLGNKTPSNNIANNIQSASQSPASPISMNEEDVAKSPPSSPTSPQNTPFVSSSKPPSSQPDSGNNEVSSVASKTPLEDETASSSSSPQPLQQQQQQQPLVNGKSGSSPVNGVAPVRHENGNNKNIEIDIPPGATTDNLPPGVLYRVVATYKYDAEDTDELSFEKGEIISVVPYDDPETQEEGWLIGVKENTGEKKMFPANFTRPL